ncbi:MAG: PQQ-binding-like beta-propeller repeat protein [Ignavibacteria bacterium]|nr:PQQ-binding-like beta-propeller repeat protein [Ignavibacteria bacterium]
MKIYIVILFIIYITGCSGITVEKDIKPEPNDWVMAGGSPAQHNFSKYVLNPPLNIMWEYNIEGGVGPAGITASDAVVFVNALQGDLFTFDVLSGGKIGALKSLGKDCSTAPLIMGNNIIFTFAGDKKTSAASYNITSGKFNWQKRFGDIQTSPILFENYIYFNTIAGKFYKIDPATGRKQWVYNSKSQVHSTCAVSGNIAVFGTDKGAIIAVNISDGKELWRFESGQPVISTPLIFHDNVYIGCNDSIYYSLSIKEGKANWKLNLHSKIISGSAIDGSGNFITGCVDGSVYSISQDGTINWKFETKGVITSSPVVSGNNVYVSSYDSYIYTLNVSTGRLVWKSPMLENKVKTQPVIWREFLFAAADEIVYCFTSKTVNNNDGK